MTPTTIDATADVVTLVNVFTVTPETQQQLVELLGRATEEVMRHRPGFVSANIHAGLDGTALRTTRPTRSCTGWPRRITPDETPSTATRLWRPRGSRGVR